MTMISIKSPSFAYGMLEFSLASILDEFIILSGGRGSDDESELAPHPYLLRVKKERWRSQPISLPLKTPRYRHSSIAIDRTVYIFGGCDANHKDLSDIEWMQFDKRGRPIAPDSQSTFSSKQAHWRFQYRQNPIMAQSLNKELLVLGGSDEIVPGQGLQASFCVSTDPDVKFRKFLSGSMSSFQCPHNQCCWLSESQMFFACVQTKSFPCALIEISGPSCHVKIVASIKHLQHQTEQQ